MSAQIRKTNFKFIPIMTIIMFVVWAVSADLFIGLTGVVGDAAPTPFEAAMSALTLLGTCFLSVLVIAWFVNRTHLSGPKLAAQVFVMMFGVMFFMTQIETLFFNSAINMPWQVLIATVAAGLLVSICVASIALRYRSKLGDEKKLGRKLDNSYGVLKFCALSLAYTIFYFVFGYFIAWQVPELREFYTGSTDIFAFWPHLQGVLRDDPSLLFFQILRGFIWAGIGYSVAASLVNVKLWERSVIVGLSLSVGLAATLFVPNEYMPGSVRAGHFFELLIENFLFGVFVTLLFRPHAPSQNPTSIEQEQ